MGRGSGLSYTGQAWAAIWMTPTPSAPRGRDSRQTGCFRFWRLGCGVRGDSSVSARTSCPLQGLPRSEKRPPSCLAPVLCRVNAIPDLLFFFSLIIILIVTWFVLTGSTELSAGHLHYWNSICLRAICFLNFILRFLCGWFPCMCIKRLMNSVQLFDER